MPPSPPFYSTIGLFNTLPFHDHPTTYHIVIAVDSVVKVEKAMEMNSFLRQNLSLALYVLSINHRYSWMLLKP